jgi:hypothetical protein
MALDGETTHYTFHSCSRHILLAYSPISILKIAKKQVIFEAPKAVAAWKLAFNS